MSETGPTPNPEEDVKVIKAIHRQELDDLKEAWRLERRSLEREADTDPLTGLPNRRALNKALPSAESDPNTAIGVFDANNFGQINKQLGQEVGDQVMKEIAEAIYASAAAEKLGARVFRDEVTETNDDQGEVYRRGGDEFVILAPTDAAHRIVRAAEDAFGVRRYGDVTVSLSGTVGATFAEADAILQEAKAARKADPEHPIHDRDLSSDPERYD